MWVDHGAMGKLQIILQEDLWLKDRSKEEDVDANKWRAGEDTLKENTFMKQLLT